MAYNASRLGNFTTTSERIARVVPLGAKLLKRLVPFAPPCLPVSHFWLVGPFRQNCAAWPPEAAAEQRWARALWLEVRRRAFQKRRRLCCSPYDWSEAASASIPVQSSHGSTEAMSKSTGNLSL